MAHKVTTQLMFEGSAGEAMDLYVSLFPGSHLGHVERYGPGEHGKEGTVKRASFTIAGREFHCIDSPVKHGFTFTPASSIFVECESQAEFDGAYPRLMEGGTALMPAGNYGFSSWFGWVQDRFGVSWQLNLA